MAADIAALVRHFGPELAEPSRDWVSNYRLVPSHWLMAEEPETVNRLILEHIGPEGHVENTRADG